MYDFSKLIPKCTILVYNYLFRLIFKKVFNSWNVNFFTVFVLFLNLSNIEGQRLQTTGVEFLFCSYFLQS